VVAAANKQAHGQHKLLRKFTDLCAPPNHHPALSQPRTALRRKCSLLRVASGFSTQGTPTRQPAAWRRASPRRGLRHVGHGRGGTLVELAASNRRRSIGRWS
jgi:hypothetical protein